MLAITLALAGLTAAPAIAASVPIADGSVTWGFKASWRDCITRHGGTITTGDGVTLTDDGAFVWPVESGSYDDEGHRLELDLAGSVRFYAWDGQLDTTLRNLTLVLSEDASAIYADVNGENIDGETVALTQAPIAEIDLTDRIPTVDGGRTTWTEVPAALTADGSFAFSYAPGIALDPVTISYVGPGGKPDLGEHWIAPGWEVFTATAVAAFHRDEEHDHDATTAFADLATGTVDYLGALGDGSTTIRWVHKDLQTDQVLGSTGQITITQPAYDPDGKLLFSGQGGPASPIVAHRWNDETGSYDVRTVIEDINGGNLWFNRQARSLMISGLLNYVPWIGARSRWERDLRRARGGHGPGGTAHPRNGNRARDRVGVLSLQASLDCVSVLLGIARMARSPSRSTPATRRASCGMSSSTPGSCSTRLARPLGGLRALTHAHLRPDHCPAWRWLKVGGENVSAAEIEGHLLRHPVVHLVQVVAAPDARYGEVAAAFVILKPGPRQPSRS